MRNGMLVPGMAVLGIAALVAGALLPLSPQAPVVSAPDMQVAGPAQATEVPPIATCAPAQSTGTATPPGLYPILSIDSVGIFQQRLPNGCPTSEMGLRICLRNDGPAPSGPFPLRIQGCGVGRLELQIEDVDMFDTLCVEVPNAAIPPGDCELMIDPGCSRPDLTRYWTGPVPHPEPLPTCTPGPDATLTPIAVTVTASPPPSATPTVPPATSTSTAAATSARIVLPFAGRYFALRWQGCPPPVLLCPPSFATNTPTPLEGTPTVCPICRNR